MFWLDFEEIIKFDNNSLFKQLNFTGETNKESMANF